MGGLIYWVFKSLCGLENLEKSPRKIGYIGDYQIKNRKELESTEWSWINGRTSLVIPNMVVIFV